MSEKHTIFSSLKENDTVDIYELLKMSRNPDGTITRHSGFPTTPAMPDPDADPHSPVLTKDVPLNPAHDTWARIYLPRQALDSSFNEKLPLIVYYHGGGFVIFSISTAWNDALCRCVAGRAPAVVISAGYRLAPEHPLPAAYDDAMEALHWMKSVEDVWLKKYADFSTCFLMGTSAGGNIGYQVGLRACGGDVDLQPLILRGMILHQPFFGGVQRSASETRLLNNPYFPVWSGDAMWELALPRGADRDHEYSNPTVKDRFKEYERMKQLGWRVLVTGCDGDPLFNRQVALAMALEKAGLEVVGSFHAGDYHGVDNLEPDKTDAFAQKVKEFIGS